MGRSLAWLIDPIEQAVSVYRPGEAAEVRNQPSSVRHWRDGWVRAGDGADLGVDWARESRKFVDGKLSLRHTYKSVSTQG